MHSVQNSINKLLRQDGDFKERYDSIRDKILSNEKVILFLKENADVVTDEMIERSLMKLHEFTDQVTNCDECKSLDECKNFLKGYYPTLVIKNKTIDIQYHMCEKKRIHDERKKMRDLVQSLYIPKDILEASFSELDLVDDGRFEAINLAEEFVANYVKGSNQKGLYFYGPFGVGKTYILGALANEFAKRKIPSMIVYVPEFFRELKNSIQNNTMDTKLDAVKNVEVLMLDDIGAESMSSWVRDDLLGPILQFRMQEKLPTFFTSNFNFDQLQHHLTYSQRGEAEEMKAARMMERIKYLMIPVEITGRNRRK